MSDFPPLHLMSSVVDNVAAALQQAGDLLH